MSCFLPTSNPALPLVLSLTHARMHGCLMLVKGQTATPPLKGTPGACKSTPITSLQLEVMNQLVTLSFYSARLPASLLHLAAQTKGLLSEIELGILAFLRQTSLLLPCRLSAYLEKDTFFLFLEELSTDVRVHTSFRAAVWRQLL